MLKHSIDDKSEIEVGEIWKLNPDVNDERFLNYIKIESTKDNHEYEISCSNTPDNWSQEHIIVDDLHIKTWFHPYILLENNVSRLSKVD